MRHIRRHPLPNQAQQWLARQQSALRTDPQRIAGGLWEIRRQTMNNNGIVTVLGAMCGIRQRCMFCGDSHGGDIEHFRPKAVAAYRAYVFDWNNFLWLCTPCNRRKGNRLPCDEIGEPLLIDPTARDPWDHLIYIPETGELLPRYDPVSSADDRYGAATADEALTRLNIEAVAEGRRRVVRHACRYLRLFLASAHSDADAEPLVTSCLDLDHPELLVWFLTRDGRDTSPFAEFVADYPALAERLLIRLDTAAPGVCGPQKAPATADPHCGQ